MRTSVLIALFLPLAACSTTPTGTSHPYAEANSLMRREIQTRIAAFPYQHGGELLNNMLWLQTKAGETAVVDLLEALRHENPKVRSSATWVLGRIHDRRTIAALRPLAADKHEAVRLEAARSLVVMGDLKYCTILIEGLDSDKTPVRYHCHMALKDATRRDFQYDHLEEDMVLRRTATLRWREWWATQSSDPWFAASYAREHNLASPTLGEAPKPMGETGRGKGEDTKPKPGPGVSHPKGEDVFKPLPLKPKQDTPKPSPAKPKTTTPSFKPTAKPKTTTPSFKPTAKPKTTPPTFKPTAKPKTATPKPTPKTTPSTPKTPVKTENPIFKLLDLDDDSKTTPPKASTPKTTPPKTPTPKSTKK